MHAIRFHRVGGPEVLALETVEAPPLRRGAVRLAVRAAGVNFADVHFRKGEYFTKPVFPQIPGLEAAGEVEAVGEGVTEFRPGDRVLAFATDGAYAESLVTPASLVFRIPSALSFEDAAALPVQGLTALHVLTLCARMKRGERLLVHAAAGGVGSLAVQLAKLQGASHVIGTASTEEKRALVRELGADEAVDYHALQGVKVDVILEMLGGTDHYKRNLAGLAPFGRMVVYGAASGDLHGTLEPVSLMAKNVSVIGYYLTAVLRDRAACEPAIAELCDHVVSGRLRILRGATLPLARAGEAHTMLEARATTGKLVLTMEERG
ncbi:MAG TPA: zinc-binding dehydrogenase [Polyangiaceae bacterium]